MNYIVDEIVIPPDTLLPHRRTLRITTATMSGPGVGFEYPPTEVSWTKRDALLFANSIGCTGKELHFLYVRCAAPRPFTVSAVADRFLGARP